MPECVLSSHWRGTSSSPAPPSGSANQRAIITERATVANTQMTYCNSNALEVHIQKQLLQIQTTVIADMFCGAKNTLFFAIALSINPASPHGYCI